MTTYEDLIGRARLDDLDAILAVANTDTASMVQRNRQDLWIGRAC